MITTRLLAALGLLCLAMAAAATAHPGGLNAQGCHNDRKTGDYHCHRAATARSLVSTPARRSALADASGGGAFRNCAAARAAGAAPVRVGDPGYGRHLDRDGDGVGCE